MICLSHIKKYCAALSMVVALPVSTSFAQDSTNTPDRDLRIEIEPASFIFRGYAASVSYNLTKNNALNVGLYSASMDIPEWTWPQIFDNVDTGDVRLGFELAGMLRYKFNLFKAYESNPYIGLIFGYEYFTLNNPTTGRIRLSTWLATPYLGYEIYLLKKMLYVNPQLRGVFYFGSGTSTDSRPETMGRFFMLPQISLGIRL
jgi:hypothetical protein